MINLTTIIQNLSEEKITKIVAAGSTSSESSVSSVSSESSLSSESTSDEDPMV